VSDIAPCPFCGGEAEIESHGTSRQSCIVSCTNCGARAEGSNLEAWNRRAEPSSIKPSETEWGVAILKERVNLYKRVRELEAAPPAPSDALLTLKALYDAEMMDAETEAGTALSVAMAQARKLLGGAPIAPGSPAPSDALREAAQEYLEWGPMTSSDRDYFAGKFRKALTPGETLPSSAPASRAWCHGCMSYVPPGARMRTINLTSGGMVEHLVGMSTGEHWCGPVALGEPEPERRS